MAGRTCWNKRGGEVERGDWRGHRVSATMEDLIRGSATEGEEKKRSASYHGKGKARNYWGSVLFS